MIGRVNVKVSSGHVNMPLQPVAVFKDGAASVFVENVPFSRDGLTITGVRVSVMNAVGETRVYEAKRQSSAWTVTVPETHFAAAGVVRNGFTVYAVGTDENGVARAWPMGRGDLYVIACDSNAVNLGEYVNLRLMDAKLDQPHKGDLVKVSGGYQLYNGTAWEALGGGGGGVPILTLATPAQNAIKKDGETVLFAALRELHLAGAVLQYDGASYYPHYHSGTELMWDCTGTMAGKVQTRRVHAVKSGEADNYTVSASARTPLATEAQLDGMVSLTGGNQRIYSNTSKSGPYVELRASSGKVAGYTGYWEWYLDGNTVRIKEDGELDTILQWPFTRKTSTLATLDDIPLKLQQESAGFTAKDGWIYNVAMPAAGITITLPTPPSGEAGVFQVELDGTGLSADASVQFAGALVNTYDEDCGTVKAGKLATMSAVWTGSKWSVAWKNQA